MNSNPVQYQHITISKRLVFINAASSIIARLINIFGLIWVYSYLIRKIEIDEFAVYPLVSAVMLFAPLLFSMFTGGISRYMIASYARNEMDDIVAIVSSIVPVLVAASGGFILLCGALTANIGLVFTVPADMEDEARLMIMLLATNFAIQMIALPFGTGYHIRQRYVELNLLMIARDSAKIALMYGFFLLMGPGVLWVVVATVAADLVYLVATTVRSVTFVPEQRFRRSSFNRVRARELMSFGVWTTLGRLAAILYVSAGTFVLNAFGSAADVTSYHLGATCFQHIQSMVGVARQPLQPALVAMHSLDDRARLARASLRGGRYGLWASLIIACPLAIFADQFANLLLDEPFADVSLVIILFMAIFFFNQPTGMLPMIAMATGEVRRFNLLALGSTLFCVVLVVLLVREFEMGALGAALAISAGTILTQLIFMWPLNLTLSGVGVRSFGRDLLAPGLAPAVTGSVAWSLAAASWRIDTWTELLVAAGAGAAVYAATLVLFCLDAADRQFFGRLISFPSRRA